MRIKNIYDKSFVDIPDSEPKVKIPLENVGVSNRPHYIAMLDPFDRKKEITVWGEINILSNLAKDQRGLHMSRFEEILHQLASEQSRDIQKFTRELCMLALKSQGAKKCAIGVSVNYEKTTDNKNLSGKLSHELIRLTSYFKTNRNNNFSRIGMIVPFFNACPCTQRWGMRDFHRFLLTENLDKKLIEKLIINAPLQAHTNRGDLTLEIQSNKVTYKDIYRILEKSSPIIRELLKGKDEHAFVKEGHKLALFCEDLARETAFNTVKMLDKKLEKDTLIKIVVNTDESVHFHNLFCEINTSLAKLKADIG